MGQGGCALGEVKPMEVRLSKASIGKAEIQNVVRVLESEFLGMGPQVGEFEKELSEFFGRPAICVSTGTAALQLALQAIGVGRGDEVLVQSLTYVASFQAISATGATAVCCDVNPANITLDLLDLESKITSKTKAIMPVHYAGGVGELDAIYELAKKYSLRVVEDAAHAFGSTYKSHLVGSFGDTACFSFDGIKNITSGEGGCIVSADLDVISAASDARLLGVHRDSQNRVKGQRTWSPEVDSQGWRYHMSDIMGAIGRVQLSRIEIFAERRRSHLKRYKAFFSQSEFGANLVELSDEVVPHIMPCLLTCDVDRDALLDSMGAAGVQCGKHYYPNHRLAYFSGNSRNLENTDSLAEKIFTIPMHVDLTNDQIDYVCATLVKSIRELKLTG